MDNFELIADYVRAISSTANNYDGSANKSDFLPSEKGLRNLLGENNCFLNVVIQSFWHLKSFRELFDGFGCTETHRPGENCIFCALQSVLLEYRFSEESVIPPTLLRKALAVNYQPFQRFQIGKLADAAEALEAILDALHERLQGKGIKKLTKTKESDSNSSSDAPCFCLAHTVFGLFCNSSITCTLCSSKTVLSNDSLFIIYTYVHSLREAFSKEPDLSFCGYMKRVTDSEVRVCGQNGCMMPCSVKRTLLQIPTVFSVGLVWERPNSTAEEIGELLDIIHLKMDLSNIFQLNNSYIYRLKGFICYYGCHYNSFFLSPESNSWFFFDDSNVKSIGEYWSLVKDKCVKGKLQPFVLFYERDIEAEIAAASETKISFPQAEERQQEGTKVSAPEPQTPNAQTSSEQLKEKSINSSGDSSRETEKSLPHESVHENKEGKQTSQVEVVQESQAGGSDEKDELDFGFVMINSNSSKLPEDNENQNLSPSTTSAADSTATDDVSPSFSPKAEEIVDIPVKISTWFYRGEEQVFRFSGDSFVRLRKLASRSPSEANGIVVEETLIDPVNEKWHYSDLRSVGVNGNYVTLQRVSKPGCSLPETLYFSSERAKDLLALIVQRSPSDSIQVSVK